MATTDTVGMDELEDNTPNVDVQDVPEEPPTKTPEHITLRMQPTNPHLGAEDNNKNLDYGPASKRDPQHSALNITFYNYTAVTLADHPLLDEVLRKYPVEIEMMEEKEKVYLDAETGKEYKSKKAYNAAQRAKKNARRG